MIDREELHRHAHGLIFKCIAVTFAELQDARHAADNEMSASYEFQFAAQLVNLAATALEDFDAVQHLPETTVFLIALPLADRWTRRG